MQERKESKKQTEGREHEKRRKTMDPRETVGRCSSRFLRHDTNDMRGQGRILLSERIFLRKRDNRERGGGAQYKMTIHCSTSRNNEMQFMRG